MKKIHLTNGGECLVDDEDFENLKQWNWRHDQNGYAMTTTRKKHLMHRIIMNPPKNMQVDHINRNKLDNRRENLRICTNQQNQMNQPAQKNNKLGTRGVNILGKKYRAQIKVNGKQIYLGVFSSIEDAIQARKSAEKRFFGEYAFKD